ncbi:MAG: hypothetical protein KC613_11510, partial [Myxococcales bacterium]|nr:hypothetical protein [Myxococcales bacterium]
GRTAGWITAAAAVGLLGAGVGCYVAAASSDAAATDAANDFNANPDPARRAAVDAEIQGHVDDFETWRALSYTGLGLGVVAGGVATWLLLDGGDGVSLAPTPGGAALVGRF